MSENPGDKPPRRGWWQQRQVSTPGGSDTDGYQESTFNKIPGPDEGPNPMAATDAEMERVIEQEAKPSVQTKTFENSPRLRWSQEERNLIFRGIRALRIKEGEGDQKETLLGALGRVLREDGMMVDENAFFAQRGVYSAMVPNVLHNMRSVVDAYLKTPEAAESDIQEYASGLRDLIDSAERGEVSPNRLKELREEVALIEDKLISNIEDAEEGGEAASMQSRIDKRSEHRPWQDKWDSVDRKNALMKSWSMDANRVWSLFTERFLVMFMGKLAWGGTGVSAKITAGVDDVFHAADGIVHMRRIVEGEPLNSTYVFDTTDAAEYGIQKLANTLRFIDMALLSTIDFGETSIEQHGVEGQGMYRLVPRLNYVISRPLAAEIALLLKNRRFDALAVHPVQLMVLKQGLAQVKAFSEYIKTEYGRNKRSMERKRKIETQFNLLIKFFTDAVKEREAVLQNKYQRLLEKNVQEDGLENDEYDMLTMLHKGSPLWSGGEHDPYGENYDIEHYKYIRVFRPDRMHGNVRDRTQAWWRLNALLEKYPPLRMDESRGEKRPIPAEDKRVNFQGRQRKSPRGESFFSGKQVPGPQSGPDDIA
jgi:hypothetical protein